MDLISLLAIVCLLHSALFFMDLLFKKCGSWRPRLLHCWFTVGSWCSLGLAPAAVYLVVKATFDIWHRNVDPGGRHSSVVLEPMIPGVNLPMSDFSYYSLTLITCSAVHELGHAIAAVREDVHVAGLGVALVLVFPVAYVQLSGEQLRALPPRRQLRVTCAGVWHNVVLALVAALALLLLPLLLYPLYDTGSGVYVRHVQQGSPVEGSTGLREGDRVVAVNQCEVGDTEDWYYCMLGAVRDPSPGYCVSSELARKHDESVPVKQLAGGGIECCGPGSEHHLCFEYLERDEGAPQLPQHSCLPVRTVVENAPRLCVLGADCPPDLHCLRPLLDNVTRLVRLERGTSPPVLYLGSPASAYRSVRVGDYVPLHRALPPGVPEAVARLCKYLVVFSAGLAAVNLVPCFWLDGRHIAWAACELLLGQSSERQAVAAAITTLGTCFLSLCFLSMAAVELL
ncbi:membrane-bound transcription factor site-2 protease isoform X2 [Bacillus rossius redtenbacheri]|uniref:membrane-bound transcription factor site-2 protease isoform X2 n=1 Tax=Bacillus rossius redtenbacheri TaxID=93214 RepID=UPI002FDDDCAC